MSLFTKFFIAFAVWTVGFLGLAAYAGEKAFQNDPQLISKIEDKFNVSIRMGGMSKGYGVGPAAHDKTQDTWNFAPPAKKVTFKSFSGNFSIKKSAGNEIKISATGKLDKNVAPRLLETEVNNDELTVREPENNAVKDLEVQIEIPASFTSTVDVLTVSGDVTAENLNVQDLDLKTVSGEMTLNQVTAKNLAVKTVSGDFKAEASSITRLEGKSVSGDLEITNTTPSNIDFTSVSGDVKMKLAKADKTHFSLKSVSGDIHNRHGSDKGGEFKVTISTTSGDIEIE
ncbi:DUF4097 family beta strand repeat-containing protein [Bdellovibrio sp. HCB-110]|uniref:DUF4097 family beta strand repeat-containing protein n=1 Tax=Bdellovibrio sp. HCB-110 TaxID=3391182 RepID=UPI0039B62F40